MSRQGEFSRELAIAGGNLLCEARSSYATADMPEDEEGPRVLVIAASGSVADAIADLLEEHIEPQLSLGRSEVPQVS